MTAVLVLKLNPLTTEKQKIKFSSAKFQKMLSPSYTGPRSAIGRAPDS